jgi:signal transduction histidine kinase
LEVGIQLQWEDARALTAANGEVGLELFFSGEPDVVLLDLTMPRMNGFEVPTTIRQVSDVPVLMLTARREDIDQVRGLNSAVTVRGRQVKFTPVEYKLLYHLVRNAGHLLPHQALLDRVWGGDYDASRVSVKPEGAIAVVAVRDYGVGIPEADLPHVFEQFHRASSVVGRIAGTGIGLAASQRIVQQHGGTIEVATSEGTGSTFTVRLPLSCVERRAEDD